MFIGIPTKDVPTVVQIEHIESIQEVTTSVTDDNGNAVEGKQIVLGMVSGQRLSIAGWAMSDWDKFFAKLLMQIQLSQQTASPFQMQKS